MKENLIKNKSFNFAIKIINFYKYLNYEKKEYQLAKQILRSGTSIGANIEEAIGGHSKNDFIYKLCTAYKEARETKYWINLLRSSNIINDEISSPLLNDCNEILRILGAIQKTIKNNS